MVPGGAGIGTAILTGGLGAAGAAPPSGAAPGPQRVIVLMRDSASSAPVRSGVTDSGGAVTRTFHTFNAFAATVSPAEKADLAGNAQVAEVVFFQTGSGGSQFALGGWNDENIADPQVAATSVGNNASAVVGAPLLENGVWFMAPDPLGPFADPAPPATFSAQLTARTLQFDRTVGSSTGDEWLVAVDPTATDANFATVDPGHSATITLQFTPNGRRGSVVSGTVFVDDFVSDLGGGDEIVAIPYRYRIG